MKKTVFVGISGGVDSAVSAAMLQKAGYEVVGVFMKTWHPDFLECNEEEERRDAMRVAAHLNIPFLTFDFENVYKKHVADYMISEYKAGRTPNPDVMCNQHVKFGAFLKKAISLGADYVATGHYARTAQVKSYKVHKVKSKNSILSTFNFQLSTSLDPSKDQAYFLWTLRQEQLKKILFPVGHLKKAEVRKLAKKFRLPVAEKKDSQGICFLGDIDLKEFLKHYIKEKKGKVVDISGKEIGYHDGVVFYTLGERHGFTITKKSPKDGAYYIVSKDINKNTLVVSQNKNISHSNILKNIRIKNTNWISQTPTSYKLQATSYSCQIRYHGEFLPCKVICGSKASAEVIFDKPVLVASGQSCVIYDKDICLGGGVVV
ncbi:tRNA 2-thiouridine(34) synthase MnmA [Candidatus Nomurabacteria bacterium RIFCSPLOWO2_01_FULL_42_17]|uniref:tRNA-specific 2-thiouridylase MnmA n=1 Tax=Candidatus Nomurabacteria bacterium RIFCSPLOWO2_01_FULL_42_17 TaxID=1801780 RepID=A0A1F6XM35_9BACT|nr:MAG: tRNA 2-thiouridine(34) synthase MnmA [Candidatus Nomurabacteria bacterium RIFCSPLOWO2_01_FULL_42_17]